MKAVILAAGLGTRLAPITIRKPKCLLNVCGRPLLEHLMSALQRSGVDETIVIAGHCAEQVREFCADRCKVLINEKYQTTNNIYSLWTAKRELHGHDFLILNCDVIYDEQMLRDFVNDKKRTACLVDNTVAFRENEFHVLIKKGRIAQYSRDVRPEESGGESAQLVKISAEDSGLYLGRIEEIVQKGGVQNYHVAAYDVLIDESSLWPIFTMGRKWFEMDTLEDYENTRSMLPLNPVANMSPEDEKENGPSTESDSHEYKGWEEVARANRLLSLFRWAIKRSLYYAKSRQWPWRFLWIRSFLISLFSRPVQAFKYLEPLYIGSLTVRGYDLQVHGPGILRMVLDEASKIGIHPFLVWGTLLGCVRQGGFIKNDHDIDLGVLQEDFSKLHALIEPMARRGFAVRKRNAYKLSFVNRRYRTLFIDIDLVYERNGHMVITNSTADADNNYSYYFPIDTFSAFRSITFIDGYKVMIPAVPEKFLETVYGDWKVPQRKSNFIYGPLNLVIEPKASSGPSPPS